MIWSSFSRNFYKYVAFLRPHQISDQPAARQVILCTGCSGPSRPVLREDPSLQGPLQPTFGNGARPPFHGRTSSAGRTSDDDDDLGFRAPQLLGYSAPIRLNKSYAAVVEASCQLSQLRRPGAALWESCMSLWRVGRRCSGAVPAGREGCNTCRRQRRTMYNRRRHRATARNRAAGHVRPRSSCRCWQILRPTDGRSVHPVCSGPLNAAPRKELLGPAHGSLRRGRWHQHPEHDGLQKAPGWVPSAGKLAE